MGLTLSDIIWPSPLFFYHFLFNFHKVNVLRYILKCPPFFWFFCLDFKIKFSPTNFGAFPYFLQFFFCLDVVDDLWHNLTTSLLFYHSLSNYHKVNVLRHILTLPPLFYFLSGVQNWIFSDIFWGLLLLFTFDDLKFFFFLIIFFPIITRSVFSDIFWLFRLFFLIFIV